MKKIRTFKHLLAAIGCIGVLLFASCSKDDDEKVVSDTSIVGTWNMVNEGVTLALNADGTYINNDPQGDAVFGKYTYDEKGRTLSLKPLKESEDHQQEVLMVKKLTQNYMVTHLIGEPDDEETEWTR